jgi:hypothetical protein
VGAALFKDADFIQASGSPAFQLLSLEPGWESVRVVGCLGRALGKNGGGGFSSRESEFSHASGSHVFQLLSRWLGSVSVEVGFFVSALAR